MIRAHQATMAIIAVLEMTLKYLICIVRQEVRGYQNDTPIEVNVLPPCGLDRGN